MEKTARMPKSGGERLPDVHQAHHYPFIIISIHESFSEEGLTFELMHERMLARNLHSNL